MKLLLIINGTVQGLLYVAGLGLYFTASGFFLPVFYGLAAWQLLSTVISLVHEEHPNANYVLHFFHWAFIGYNCLLLLTVAGRNCDAFPSFFYTIILFILLISEVLVPLLITLVTILNIRRISVPEPLPLK
ncbi:hypothetical protein HGH93_00570 [Chitinophaga polysaccharea]|uniref:hypothetical protein n=1 Tax=Chitinophaga TaxID=79328 RepID=UPI001454EE59|nr:MULTISPECIES: hypothetical protein [Chitinophaga]NLR56572.1 hypothetical protein [Chitinophaga polysaccharea]NLU92801.1 hypothetical protein [Chitinophaga sp. Ak27]